MFLNKQLGLEVTPRHLHNISPLMRAFVFMNAEQQPIQQLEEPRWPDIREINRSKGVLGAGARALTLQLSHPWVAQAINDTGYLEGDPFNRLKATAKGGFDLIFEEPKEAIKVAQHVRAMHSRANGILTEDVGPHYRKGDRYDARNQEALKWVAATLIDSSIVGHETFVGPLDDGQKDGYLANAKELFATVELEPDQLPNTYEELQEYMKEMIESQKVMVSDIARRLLPSVMISHSRSGEVMMSYTKLATIALLPEEIRDQFSQGLKNPTEEEKKKKQYKLQRPTSGQLRFFDLSTKFLRGAMAVTPDLVGLNKQARDAERRLETASSLGEITF